MVHLPNCQSLFCLLCSCIGCVDFLPAAQMCKDEGGDRSQSLPQEVEAEVGRSGTGWANPTSPTNRQQLPLPTCQPGHEGRAQRAASTTYESIRIIYDHSFISSFSGLSLDFSDGRMTGAFPNRRGTSWEVASTLSKSLIVTASRCHALEMHLHPSIPHWHL